MLFPDANNQESHAGKTALLRGTAIACPGKIKRDAFAIGDFETTTSSPGIVFKQFQIPETVEPKGPMAILRILNGIHKGAQVRLHSGAHTIGSSDKCDFVLKDPRIEPEHMVLLCRKNRITAIKKDGAIRIDGKKIENNEAQLNIAAIVTIGTVQFRLIADEKDWEPILPIEQFDKGGIAKEPSGATDATDSNELQHCSQFQKRVTSRKTCKFVFAIALIIFGVFFSLGQKMNKSMAVAKMDTTVVDISRLFEELDLPMPQISYEPASEPEVVGYTRDKEQQERVVQKLKTLPFEVKYNIYSGDEIEQLCRQVISRMAWLIDVEYREQGSVVLKGFIKDEEDADAIARRLKQDVIGIRDLEENLWPLSEVMSYSSLVLRDFKLDKKVDLRPQNGYLLASGVLKDQERQDWQTAKETICKLIGKGLVIKEANITAQETEYIPGRVNLPITGVTFGEQPCITMKGGKRYFEGGSLKNGNIIKDISSDKIVVEINGRDYFYDIAYKMSTQQDNSAGFTNNNNNDTVSAGVSKSPVSVGIYDNLINEAAIRYDVPSTLIRSIIKAESGFNPRAVSAKGAVGLMQIMPKNFDAFGISDPFDPKENIMGGTRYLKELMIQFDQKLALALAAYNAGPSAVHECKGIPNYEETQRYVKRVMRFYKNFKNKQILMNITRQKANNPSPEV